MNPYETLGVSQSAKQDEIRDAYRKLAKKFHPDLNPGNKAAEARFKDINAAYEAVGTPEQRAKFEQGEQQSHESAQGQSGRRGPFYHQTQQQGSSRYDFSGMDEDFLSSIFGQAGAGAQRRDRPGQDVLYQLPVEFVDAVLGAEKEITLANGKRLRVKIPPGVESGVKLRFTGQGGAGTGEGAAGDAYVELKVQPSGLFKRLGADLEIELPISFSEALLGAEVLVPTIDGSVRVKIPPRVSSGNRLRISGKGVPSGQQGKRGDQYAVIKIIAPRVVDSDFEQAVDAWSKRQSYDPRADWPKKGGAS